MRILLVFSKPICYTGEGDLPAPAHIFSDSQILPSKVFEPTRIKRLSLHSILFPKDIGVGLHGAESIERFRHTVEFRKVCPEAVVISARTIVVVAFLSL